MNLIILDTETSDLDPSKGATILELAWLKFEQSNNSWLSNENYEKYIQYSGPISPNAQALHHITAEQLLPMSGAVTRDEAILALKNAMNPDTILVAHNRAFDSGFLPEIDGRWICTFRAAKHIWPEAPAHSNQVLRYWLGVTPNYCYIKDRYPHQAMYDVAVTTAILQKMLERYTIDDLLTLTNRPVRLRTISFGKHKGMNFEQIPRDYLSWLRRQPELDSDLKYTLDSILSA